jgi:hypothetical protein
MDGIAGFPSFARPLAWYVPPPFIRRRGGRKENSKFVIVFICITMVTKDHGKGRFILLNRRNHCFNAL